MHVTISLLTDASIKDGAIDQSDPLTATGRGSPWHKSEPTGSFSIAIGDIRDPTRGYDSRTSQSMVNVEES